MKARARLFGHPVHQMLIVFPLGLLAASVVFDLIGLIRGTQDAHTVAYWTLIGGLIGAAVAIPFGFIDWTAIPRNTRARQIGMFHGVGNGVVSLLFFIALIAREPQSVPPLASLLCAWAGTAGVLVTAWLGGELVFRHGVGVDENARPLRSRQEASTAGSPLTRQPTPGHLRKECTCHSHHSTKPKPVQH